MNRYPEIEALQNILKQHHFAVEETASHPNFTSIEHIWLQVQLNQIHFTLLVDDEYKDFQLQNDVMNLCLVLRELENYQEEEDILKWTNLKGLNVAKSDVLEYYRGLATIYAQVTQSLGTIDSQISDFDFGLNAGAAQALRRQE
jgi:hypothetical protein